jgi:hypothetical protein
LGPLADHGGPTLTHALVAGSPAIDAGDPNFDPADPDGDPLTDDAVFFDQRGAPFERVFDGDGVGGARLDIGAFERQPIPPAVFGDYNRNGIVDAADYVIWRKTLGMVVAPFSGADGDGDGTVEQDDLAVWKAHFGETVPVVSGGGGVDGETGRQGDRESAGGAGVEIALAVSQPATNSSEPVKARASELRIERAAARLVFGENRVARQTFVRRAVGPRIASRLAVDVDRHDEGLAAWLASREGRVSPGDADRFKNGSDDERGELSDSRLDALDAAFARISLRSEAARAPRW